MSHFVLGYFSREDGATAIEYGLIAAGISIVIAGVAFLVGQQLVSAFSAVLAVLSDAVVRLSS